MSDININITSDLVEKMWESLVDKGIGGFLKPAHIRRVGAAQTDIQVENILKIAQAEKTAEAIKNGTVTLAHKDSLKLTHHTGASQKELDSTLNENPADIIKAVEANQFYKTIRKEINVAKAIMIAEKELVSDSASPPDENVDEDWLHRWQDFAGEVAAEDMQYLWGRLLAGEVKRPGSFSLRTLDMLRSISKEDAEKIARLAPYHISGDVLYRDDILDKHGIVFSLLIEMQELGMLSGVDSTGMRKYFNTQKNGVFSHLLTCKGTALLIEHEDESKSLKLPCYKFTIVGQQIMELCEEDINEEYLLSLADTIMKKGFVVKLAKCKSISADMLEITETEELSL